MDEYEKIHMVSNNPFLKKQIYTVFLNMINNIKITDFLVLNLCPMISKSVMPEHVVFKDMKSAVYLRNVEVQNHLSWSMGQVLKKIKEQENEIRGSSCSIGFPDLAVLPPEISLCVLSHLNATDLCLAACVWGELAQDQILWQSLCQSQWGYASIYSKEKSYCHFSYHHLYLQLDEGTVTFNADAFMGMEYFIKNQLIDDTPQEIAHFIYSTRTLNIRQKRLYLNSRRDVLSHLIGMHNFSNQFLPHALRRFFESLQAPNQLDNYLHFLLEKFSARFCQCNPSLQLNSDMVYILCFSLIMLSVDLTSPHIKNKMSKREFIRNVRYAIHKADDELFGHMYDDVYLRGHIAPNSGD